MNNIKITKTEHSRLPSVDFDNIPFGQTFSDHMFSADYIDGKWQNIEIIPFGDLSISPVNLALHYGQSIFEGMKAFVKSNGTPTLFRPEKHVERINASANRMMMPTLTEELFLEAVHTLVDLEKEWIPKAKGSALYLAILKGITRMSIIEILKEDGVTVEERPISMDEIIAAHKSGELTEMFGSGTAAVVANVSGFSYKDELYPLSDPKTHDTANNLRKRINDMRAGDIEDKFGWVIDVKSSVKA